MSARSVIIISAAVLILGVPVLLDYLVEKTAASLDGKDPVQGPVVQVDDVGWLTEILDIDDEHNGFAFAVIARPPEGFDAASVEFPFKLLHEICSAILVDFDGFNRFGIQREELDHIDLNVRIGSEMAMRHDVTMWVKDDACTKSYFFDRADPDVATASAHSKDEHVRANVLAWGLREDEFKFSSSSSGNRIEVTYELLKEFDRAPETINPVLLCVLSLVSRDPEESILGFDFSPSDYQEMAIKVQTSSSAGFFSYSRSWGTANLSIDGGTCTMIDAADDG